MRGKRVVTGLLDRTAAALQQKAPIFLFLVTWALFLTTAFRAAHRLFWYDELLTVKLCALPRLADLWAAVRTGIDLNPPLQYVAVRASQAVFGNNELGTRLPVVAGFSLMSLCLFLYLRRRISPSLAFAGMLLPWLTEAYRFALDARPYGILLGCSAVALLCWSRAAETSRRPVALIGLAFSLGLALLTHCYAAMLAIPFGAGELVRLRIRRRADWPMWAAFGVSALPVGLYPLLLAAQSGRALENSPFHVTLSTVPGAYQELLQPMLWPLIAAAVILIAAMGSDEPAVSARVSLPKHELAALAGFAAIPVFAVAAGALTTGSFSLRYGSPGVIGIACLFAWATARLVPNPARTGAALALLFFGWFLGTFGLQWWEGVHGTTVRAAGPAAPVSQRPRVDVPGKPMLSLASDNNLPVVIASGLAFLEVNHYAEAAFAGRTYYLTNQQAALRYTGSSWFDTSYPAMKRIFGLPGNVEDADAFLAAHSAFLMHSNGYSVEWLMPELLSQGWHLRVLAKNGTEIMTEVTAP